MSYKNTSIKSVVDKINRSYFIPDIQRHYVWLQNPKARRIEQLFDSLMRGYPIGAFLFWNLQKSDIESEFETEDNNNKLNFQLYKFIENFDARKPHNIKIDVSKIVDNDLHIVLDGQQRLTSLYIGLRGSIRLKRPHARTNNLDAYEEKKLYLNVRHTPKDDTPEDGYEFEFKTREEVKNAPSDERWFWVGKVLEFENEEALWKYCEEQQYSRYEEKLVQRLWTMVNKDDVISYFEETEKDLDKVLKIFIRVNSGGMQLSYSDLLMSLLTASFKSDIRTQMEEETEWMKDQGFSCFGQDQILKTCLMLSDCDHVFKLQNFSKTNIGKMEQNWDTLRVFLHTTIDVLKDMGYADRLSSGYIISAICYYLYKKGIQKPTEADKRAIKKFVQTAQMRGYFSTSLDTKLTQIKNSINGNQDFTAFMEDINKLPNFRIGKDYLEWAIENVGYGDPAVFPILQMLYPNLNYGHVKFHIDHIYPKSKFKKSNRTLPAEFMGRANELWNLQLLEGISNIEKSNKDPEEWLNERYGIAEGSETREAYHRTNYIPSNYTLDWETIGEFSDLRKQALLNRLMNIFDIPTAKDPVE